MPFSDGRPGTMPHMGSWRLGMFVYNLRLQCCRLFTDHSNSGSPTFQTSYCSAGVRPQQAAPYGADRHLDHLDIVVTTDGDRATCRWGGCNATLLGGTYKAHFKGHHSAGRVSEDARCQWVGCRSKPMKAGSLERHVRVGQLHMVRFQCSRCGAKRRRDAYVSQHGPARLCEA